jgi:hypothetical protein
MGITRRRATIVVAVVGAGLAAASSASLGLSGVPQAQPRIVGQPQPNVLAGGLTDIERVRGSQPLENPNAVADRYGYYTSTDPAVPLPPSTAEAQKSEPDKNTYLVFPHGLSGADPHYRYGTHFLFQGHEGGTNSYFTRVNLDADAKHRVTFLGAVGNAFVDGSTWNPFARRLLFTGESLAPEGGVWQATPGFPSTIVKLTSLGFAGYEGVQTDRDGNVWLVADVGGTKGTVASHARQPNSFVYRFRPFDRANLTRGGVLQALQVIGSDGHPIVFHDGQADADIASQAMLDLHTYGKTFATRWVTVHDSSAPGGGALFDANAAAKAAHATPFKRPENGVFRPGTQFRQFAFTETGDTDARTEAGAAHGGFGAIFMVSQSHASSSHGTLRMVFRGDLAHTGLDNIAWFSKNQVAAVEDAGDTLHEQRNGLDSGYLFDVRVTRPSPLRFLAEGRDASATIDSFLAGASTPGFTNDGDNEITGIHVSDGNVTVKGLLGAKVPRPWHGGWRVFWTQQHGDNTTFEIVREHR